MGKATQATLTAIYTRLLKTFGPQKWWPAKTQFEVIVGAILTQNTNWGNVEKALINLKEKRLLSPRAFKDISAQKLASLIKPAGYFNVKARRLKNFICFFFKEYNGDLKKMAKEDYMVLRRRLLQVNGIGPETADSILLYALNKPIFVVDAYTKRVLYRHNIVGQTADYHELQNIFMKALVPDIKIFNEYHALIVRLGKDYCKPKPLCEQCILNNVHYSLINKCGYCHRALPEKKGKKSPKSRYLRCKECAK